MKIFDFLRGQKAQKRTAAQVAKERLQIIVSHESNRSKNENFIKDLQLELLEVISKYINIDKEQIKVQLEQHGDQSVLELNVTLPDSPLNLKVKTTGETKKVEATKEVSSETKVESSTATASKEKTSESNAPSTTAQTQTTEKKAESTETQA